jgi:hypothetical protein
MKGVLSEMQCGRGNRSERRAERCFRHLGVTFGVNLGDWQIWNGGYSMLISIIVLARLMPWLGENNILASRSSLL